MIETSSETPPRLEMRGMRKYFAASGVLAVADVSLEVAPGRSSPSSARTEPVRAR